MKKLLKKIISYYMIIDEVKLAKILLKMEVKHFRIILFNVIFNHDIFINEMKEIYYSSSSKADLMRKNHFSNVNQVLKRYINFKNLSANDTFILQQALDCRFSYYIRRCNDDTISENKKNKN